MSKHSGVDAWASREAASRLHDMEVRVGGLEQRVEKLELDIMGHVAAFPLEAVRKAKAAKEKRETQEKVKTI